MLAAIPGELIGLVIFGVAALLKWLGDRAAEKESLKGPPAPQGRGGASEGTAASTHGDAEAERRRRFMEALGLPPPDEVRPVRDTPQILRPKPSPDVPGKRRESRTKPIPPIVFQDPAERRKQPAKPVFTPPPLPTPEIASPYTPVAAQVHVPASAAHAADHIELQGLSIGDIGDTTRPTFRDTASTSLREELQTRDSVRRAFILREILGPPLGLQSPNSVPSFRAP